MIGKWLTIPTAIVLTICFVNVALSDEGGNKRKGKYTYRKVYKACHARGEAVSPKPVLNPDAKTQAEWKDIFENKKYAAFGCVEEWNTLSEQALLDIFTYLHDHAADSPTPLKCK